jgi:hypothetical protein
MSDPDSDLDADADTDPDPDGDPDMDSPADPGMLTRLLMLDPERDRHPEADCAVRHSSASAMHPWKKSRAASSFL